MLLKLKTGDLGLPEFKIPMPTGSPRSSPGREERAKFPGAEGGGGGFGLGDAFSWFPSAPGVMTPSLKVTPLTPAIGATVEGVSLSEALSTKHRDQIRAALLKFQVLTLSLPSPLLLIYSKPCDAVADQLLSRNTSI